MLFLLFIFLVVIPILILAAGFKKLKTHRTKGNVLIILALVYFTVAIIGMGMCTNGHW